MNELENQSTPAADVSSPAVENSDNQTSPEVNVQESEKQEKKDACAIESSPSSDLAAAADRLDAEKESEMDVHSMTKEQIVATLKEIVETEQLGRHKDVTALKQAYYALEKKRQQEEVKAFEESGKPIEEFASTPDPTDETVKQLLAEFREKRNAYLEELEQKKRQNLEKKNKIIEEMNSLSDDIDNINLHFPKFQELQQAFKEAGDVPAGDDTEIWKKYQLAVEQFYDRFKLNKELRDFDFKKNLELKNSLVEKAKELASLTNPVEAFRALQNLHIQWREIGPVAYELREEIWNKFKEATTVINRRHQEFFEGRKAEEQANEKAKTELCEKAEAIDFSTFKTFAEWDNATKEILDLQSQWKELGFAARKVNNALFARFRTICDKFFGAKADYFKKTKEESRENLSRKEALCEQAEALADKFADKEAFDKMRKLQEEWKTIGVVRRRQGDEIWKRFCTAVDAFYDARRKLFGGKRDEENNNLQIKNEIIERLKNIPEDAERNEVISEIRELQDKWQATGHVPFKQKEDIYGRYRAELDRLFKAFDMKENTRRMRRYEGEVKKMAGDEKGRERDKLQRAIEAKEAEMKTIENNMGFFKFQTSADNPMLKEYQKKIEKLKEDIGQIRDKIKMLDKPQVESQPETETKPESVEDKPAEEKPVEE